MLDDAMDYFNSIPLMMVDHVPRLEYARPRPVRVGPMGMVAKELGKPKEKGAIGSYERITGRLIPCAEEAEWIWQNDPTLQLDTWYPAKCDCPACPRYACRHHTLMRTM